MIFLGMMRYLKKKIDTRGQAASMLREIGFKQFDDTVAQTIYSRMEFANLGPPPQRDLMHKSFADSGTFLFERISEFQQRICNLQGPAWRAEFERLCNDEALILRPKWETDWVSLCDGKRFFRDLHSRFGVRVSPLRLKVRIMERLERERADEWVLIESFLREALKA